MFLLRRADCYGPANTEDLWKLAALVLMTLDHIGDYLFPEQLWWRVVGRAAFPIWLFFVGYHMAAAQPASFLAMPRQAPWLLVFTGWVFALDAIGSRELLPLSILFTILLVKLALSHEKVQAFVLERPFLLCGLCALAFPIGYLWEYGAMGLLFAALGFRMGRGCDKSETQIVAFVTIVLHAAIENSAFAFTEWQQYAATGVIFVAIMPLLEFKARAVERLPLPGLICFYARNSLLYYVLHLTALQLLALALFK